MKNEIKTEIAVIGAGAAGLMVTKKLSELGYKVTLIERQSTIASGPSLKNEGWLHKGAYHSVMIEDKNRARETVEQILYGQEQILRFAPEAVEDPGVPVLSLVHNESLATKIEERWKEFDIANKPLTKHQLAERAPELNQNYINLSYITQDLSVDYRILYQKLLHTSERAGAKVLTATKFIPEEENKGVLELPNGSKTTLSADLYICTTGLGTKTLFDTNLGVNLDIRYWKSHTLIFPRLARNSVFFLDTQEASIMNHGEFSIACQAEDDFQVEEPNCEVIEEAANRVYEATLRLLPKADNYAYKAISCIKPNIKNPLDASRLVNDEIHEPLPNYLVAFPGKVTSSPYMADKLIHTVFNRQRDRRIASRPIDLITF